MRWLLKWKINTSGGLWMEEERCTSYWDGVETVQEWEVYSRSRLVWYICHFNYELCGNIEWGKVCACVCVCTLKCFRSQYCGISGLMIWPLKSWAVISSVFTIIKASLHARASRIDASTLRKIGKRRGGARGCDIKIQIYSRVIIHETQNKFHIGTLELNAVLIWILSSVLEVTPIFCSHMRTDVISLLNWIAISTSKTSCYLHNHSSAV